MSIFSFSYFQFWFEGMTGSDCHHFLAYLFYMHSPILLTLDGSKIGRVYLVAHDRLKKIVTIISKIKNSFYKCYRNATGRMLAVFHPDPF